MITHMDFQWYFYMDYPAQIKLKTNYTMDY